MNVAKLTVKVVKKDIVIKNPTNLSLQQLLLSGTESGYLRTEQMRETFVNSAKKLNILSVKPKGRKKKINF